MNSQGFFDIPFKSELDLTRSGSDAAIPLPYGAIATGLPPNSHTTHGNNNRSPVVDAVLSPDALSITPTSVPKDIPIVVPNITKKARGRQVPTAKEALLKPGISTRSFACKVESCRKVFTRSEHLKRHIRSIHTDERPFQCDVPDCGKSFTRHDNLLQHRRGHRGCAGALPGTSDTLGPLERVYMGTNLARETYQRRGTARPNATDAPLSPNASMGVLLPSPLTTVPALHSRMTVERITIFHAYGATSNSPSDRSSPSPTTPTKVRYHPHHDRDYQHHQQRHHHLNFQLAGLDSDPHMGVGRCHNGPFVSSDRPELELDAVGSQSATGAVSGDVPDSEEVISSSILATTPSNSVSATATSTLVLGSDSGRIGPGSCMSSSPLLLDAPQPHSTSAVSDFDSADYLSSFYQGDEPNVDEHSYMHIRPLRTSDRYRDDDFPPAFRESGHSKPLTDHANEVAAGSATQYRCLHYEPPLVHLPIPIDDLTNGKGSYSQWRRL